MHVVLSDERVYLTEYPPRTLTTAFSFRRVRDIELVNDLPDFLQGKERELCQHIRITYVTDEPARRGRDWLRKDRKAGLPPAPPPSRRTSYCPTITHTLISFIFLSLFIRSYSERDTEEGPRLAPTRSASCPNSETLGLPRVPHPPNSPTSLYSTTSSSNSTLSNSNQRPDSLEHGQAQRRFGSVLSRLLKRDHADSREEREAELHLYAVSHTSRLYLSLQSSWNSFIIRSTQMLDPLHRGRCRASSDSPPGKRLPAISWERTAHLFGQLSSELLQEGLSVESLYLLLQELKTAAHRNVALRGLFWRSADVCDFLVQTLEESLHGCHSLRGVCTADQLLLSTLIVETLAVMFRETEVEPARLSLLSAKKGALTSRMLLALVCDPELQTQNQESSIDHEVSCSLLTLTLLFIISVTVVLVCLCQLQALLAEYLDAACSLLFELLLLGHEASRCSSADNFLSVGWILRVLQPHPHLTSFTGYQAQQVVLVLSDPQESFLSPPQSVLLFQRCRLLLACMQHNNHLAQHLRSNFREEFRYFVNLSCAEVKLPPHYPISQPTLRLVEQILSLHR
ncbi:protein C12orf56 [Nibea albiflora]|uniref:Protein C12orf56 n=1 Tax=Nibea albiflora TaxID=240163 RepID=A0ACB7EU02_NIBAL|nr:protein C12orf56 [Nibea albiflora]